MRAAIAHVEVLRPRSLEDALAMMADGAAAGRPLVPLAGGTDLLVALNAGQPAPARYLDLWHLDELRGIDRGEGRRKKKGHLVFGALATYTDCIQSRAVVRHLPILARAASEVGGAQIQNRGTLAGNVGNGSPAGDSLPVLMAADATVVLASTGGEREVPLTAYYTGYRQTVRRADELIVRIEVTAPRGAMMFRKVGTRAAQAISKVVLAATGLPDGKKAGERALRLAFGSVAPTVVRARRVEEYVQGGGRDLAEATRLLGEDITPIDDVRSTGTYRRRVAANLLAEVLRHYA